MGAGGVLTSRLHIYLRPQIRVSPRAGDPTYLGFVWEGVHYTWAVIPFGYSLSPWVYQTLSAATASCMRSLGVPVLVWLDDFFSCGLDNTPERSGISAKSIFIVCAAMMLSGRVLCEQRQVRACAYPGG